MWNLRIVTFFYGQSFVHSLASDYQVAILLDTIQWESITTARDLATDSYFCYTLDSI